MTGCGERYRRARSPRSSRARARRVRPASTAARRRETVHGASAPADVERAVATVVAAARPARHPRQLRRSARDRRRLHDGGRGMGERDRVNLSGTFYCCQAAARSDARERRRGDRQHLVGRRADRALASARLHRRQARRRRADEEPRARPRARRHPRQRDLPGPDPHAADRAVLRGRAFEQESRDDRSAAPLRRAARRRPGGALPGERDGLLRQRRRADRSTAAGWPRRASSRVRDQSSFHGASETASSP